MESKKSIYIIRHGQSKYNVIKAEMLAKGAKDENDHKFRKDLIDCELTDLGIQQAKEAGEKLKDINIPWESANWQFRTTLAEYGAQVRLEFSADHAWGYRDALSRHIRAHAGRFVGGLDD